MTWPAAVQTVRLTVGQTHDALGADVAASLTVEADFGGASTITWAATNDTMTTLVGSGGEVELPSVDQVGWVDPTGQSIQGWVYVAELVLRVGSQIKVVTRRFQVLLGQEVIDFFELPDDDPGTVTTAPAAPLTLPQIQAALVQPHIDDPAPHPAYDDMPNLITYFENGLA